MSNQNAKKLSNGCWFGKNFCVDNFDPTSIARTAQMFLKG